mmetsp:Transcript_23101/g.69425  ORF Transcript_23101/g.69425 Transcript_23101/m.69425 type:complete len:91 (+) Transcript_23101:1668-1940(+)
MNLFFNDDDTFNDLSRALDFAEMFRVRGRDCVEAKMRRRRWVVCYGYVSIRELAFLICARCCDAGRDRLRYCSEACQKADWDAGHELICK